MATHHRSDAFQRAMQHIAEAYGSSGYRRDTMLTTPSNRRLRWRPLYPSAQARLAQMPEEGCARVDLGAVWECCYTPASGPNRSLFDRIEGKELVFDLDAKDQPARPCACGASKKVCAKCWRELLLPQARELVQTLGRVLEVTRLCALFSGRGGWHVWCTDRTAWAMSDQLRADVVHYVHTHTSMILDKEVTTRREHLIRAPLSAHQATGFLVCPLDLRAPDGGVPLGVPADSAEGRGLARHHADSTLREMWHGLV